MRRFRGFLSGIIGCITVAFVVLFPRRASETFADTRHISSNADIRTDSQITNDTQKYVTPSLSELGARGLLSKTNNDMLMLTRVPGAGAELLVLLLQRLQGYNAFKHIRMPSGNDKLLSTLQQELLVEQVTGIIRQEAIPLSFDGDHRFLNFSAFARQAPTFISIIRDPMDPRIRQNYKKDDSTNFYRGSISHFCGQDFRCSKKPNKWAMKRAMDNVARWYRVVGTLDHIEATLVALEHELPHFFNGVTRLYNKIRLEEKLPSYSALTLNATTEGPYNGVLKMENEFYEWVKSRLLNGTSDSGRFEQNERTFERSRSGTEK